MKDLISIIIPCYNAEKCLSISLNSIREQSYKNLEIIIVNDGSKDNTLEVANSFASIDDRIKVVTQENAGVSVARNNGVAEAKGEFIMFLDADDNYTTPLAIEKMYNRIVETNADMCVCNFTHPCFEQHTKGTRIYDMQNDNDFLEFYQDFFVLGVPWNKITRRECLTEQFVPGVKFNEDELYNLDNLHNMKTIAFTDEVLHHYYCAPYNPNLPASAVNSIYSQDFFWEKRSTIWHMGMKNHEYRVNSLSKFFPDKKEELQYVRSFDFFFWDFFLMAKNRVKEEHIVHTIKSIFETELFQNTIKAKERYGVKLLETTELKIEEFVKLAYNAFIDIKTYNKKLSMLKVFMGLFGHFFYEITENINTVDILAKSTRDVIDLSSAEGYYVQNLLDMYQLQKTTNNCNIVMFEKNMQEWMKSSIG
ncbi:MAG: glycosyltransferase family 2 protein [Clostridia bacterium]|nr:glycosyltransferase family 2 protein [Clostridia bacterium]